MTDMEQSELCARAEDFGAEPQWLLGFGDACVSVYASVPKGQFDGMQGLLHLSSATTA